MSSAWRLDWLSSDGKKLLLTRVLRSFGYGYLAVVLALYLSELGLDTFQIGIVLTAAVGGSAAMTVFWSLAADRFGRRRTAMTMAGLMTVGGLLFAGTDNFWLLLLAGFTGTISATSGEVGVFNTIEQAILPQTAPDRRRTWAFSVYNTLASLAGAAGALFAGSVAVFAGLGLSGADAYRPLFVLYALIGLANLLLFAGLSDKVEAVRLHAERRFVGLHRSRGTVVRLSVLFGLDAFAGGFVVHSLVAYWFSLRWGLGVETLGVVFFWVGVLSGLSLLAAGWLAGRIGLINTMVFTHLPSNVLLLLVPLAPSAELAVLLFLVRMSISQMDVPTRQSYTMAVVAPDERTAAAGLTNVARSTASAISPALAGLAMGTAALGAPFFIAGGLKIAYDLLVFRAFRHVRPPEELADGFR
ncbi:MAG TPA: MFS transporter [Candidatus Limnocylindria bacterium]|nr:MFS transporter [Candidatus Limnocylindria bacterium]